MAQSGLRKLQHCLERLYEVTGGHDIEDFLITDPGLARTLDNGPRARENVEKLLVQQDGEDLSIALYLDAGVMQALHDNDPLDSLNDGNLESFLTALEGVSHFLYLVWNARHGREVSRFELELQAEVDKYAAAVLLLASQQHRHVPRELHRRLFTGAMYDEALQRGERRRYERANYYAGLYCGRLQQECLQERRSSMVRELRRFYRLTHRHKLRHIDNRTLPRSGLRS